MISQFAGVCLNEISRTRQPTNHEPRTNIDLRGVVLAVPNEAKEKMAGRGKVFKEFWKTLSVKVGPTKKGLGGQSVHRVLSGVAGYSWATGHSWDSGCSWDTGYSWETVLAIPGTLN